VDHSTESPAFAAITRIVWRKSMASNADQSACVEVALLSGRILVRDSKDAIGPQLRFTWSAWQVFIGSPDYCERYNVSRS
jgi:hypothetical protein